MLTPLERVNNLIADLRYAQVDFDALFAGKNSLTPLESVELFLAEQQRLRVLKQPPGQSQILCKVQIECE